MLKERRQLFETMFMVFDLVVVTIAWFLAYALRFNTDLIPVDKGIPRLHDYALSLIFIWIIWATVFKWMGLYRAMRGVRPIKEFFLLLNANLLSILLLIAVVYLFIEKTIPFSRLVFIYFGILAFFLTLLQRGVLRFILREARRKGYNIRYILIVGDGNVSEDIIERIKKHEELGVQIVGRLSHDGIRSNEKISEKILKPANRDSANKVPVVGSYKDLGFILSLIQVDQVVVALPLEHSREIPEVMAQVKDTLIDVKIIPDMYQFITLGCNLEEFEGLPVISAQSTPLVGWGLILKRMLDLVIASTLILILSPILLLIAILVRLTSNGSILYRQERLSVDGSAFSIIKFRTMASDAEIEGPGWTVQDDKRVTRLGAFLRSTSLDELPQLINVLKGDMSIVGPRPERPVFIDEFRKRVPKYMLRHKVPAGITGWAQVNGWRGDTSIDKRIEYDLYYIENWSLFLDLKILILTIFKGFKNRNAY